jgi:hypothetical protein
MSWSVKFPVEPVYRDLPSGRARCLVNDVPVIINGQTHVIPAGFVTDGASVPRGLWNLFPPFGRYFKAALLHDWLYQYGTMTRAQADLVFLTAMKELGVGLLTRWAMYAGVRVGGWPAWDKYQFHRQFFSEMDQD